ncbi:MAG TPA: hypothetical protein PKE39_14430 [Ignavibacteria bacterium]|nr:hypothetical protein [Ignavibacteria bacterium]HMR00215.1 hypothetical protein [Ignavibacteria bacterium]
MKKIIFILALFLSTAAVNAQWTSFPFTLVDDSGDPMTGQASNVKFTKYPHTYPDDIISGITVSEIGTQGTYNATGFTTLQFAKMWLSGVVRTEFDSVLTGNLFTYLNTNYWRTNAAQTSLSGAKSIASGNWTISTGDWLKLAGTETWNKPYVYSGSSWYSDYSELGGASLIFKNAGDSLYGLKGWYYDGTKLRLLSSSYKWYGRTSITAPFEYNTSQFDWSSDKLNLLSTAVNQDSAKHKIITSGKDTTWVVLGEDVTKWRFLSLKKGFWYNSYSIPDWKWVYESYNESGVLQAMDSMMVINEATSVDNETSVGLTYDGTYIKVDSLLLPPGKYTIDFAIMWERGNHNDPAQMNISDTIIVALKEQSSAPNAYIVNSIRHIETYADTTNFSGGVLQWSTVHTVYSTPKYVYLYGRYVANALATALGLGPTAGVTRGKIVATLVR